MKVRIVTFDQIKDKNIATLGEYYQKLLSKYCKVENVQIKDRGVGKVTLEMLSKHIDTSYNIFLTEKGKEFSTEGFSSHITHLKQNHSSFSFFIANAFGFEEEVLQKADLCLSLSQMTMSHELAYLILAEQLFRCFNLAAGGKYHK